MTNGVVHFHCCVIDGVHVVGEDGQVHFAEASALTPEDLAPVRVQVRARCSMSYPARGTERRGAGAPLVWGCDRGAGHTDPVPAPPPRLLPRGAGA
jgi:hypothetical protein